MLRALMPFAVGLVEIVVLWGAIALAVAAAGAGRRRRSAQRERDRLLYECYAAERFIRDARRQAVHDLQATERAYRDRFGDDDVIEGTAVEVRE